MASPYGGNAQNFAGRCYAGPALRDAVVNHRGHAGLYRRFVDDIAVGLGADEAAYALIDRQDLEHTDPSSVAGAAATLAALWFIDRFPGLEPERTESRIVGEVGRSKIVSRLAAVAQLPHQPLSDHGA